MEFRSIELIMGLHFLSLGVGDAQPELAFEVLDMGLLVTQRLRVRRPILCTDGDVSPAKARIVGSSMGKASIMSLLVVLRWDVSPSNLTAPMALS